MDNAKRLSDLSASTTSWQSRFRDLSEDSFAFLLERGFELKALDNFHLRYQSKTVACDLFFEPFANEISLWLSICDFPNDQFELTDYRRWALSNGQPDFPTIPCIPERSADGLKRLLDEFAVVVKDRSAPLLAGNRAVYSAMDQLRTEYQKIEREKAALNRIRVVGAAFWKDRNLRGVVETYSSIEDKLLPSEQMKLEYARKHLVK
ncbi:hypothetical protein ACFPT7_24195 [Acidicapsa dinghuensis]|uniref:Uncharacterized protein n=1 Tax=Acidicapsa dinghuensis TaxID=2218256 RepID=A0ABW1EN08_9BACT|nr:hypothetical protein [Acidicapsa dinghuensis]